MKRGWFCDGFHLLAFNPSPGRLRCEPAYVDFVGKNGGATPGHHATSAAWAFGAVFRRTVTISAATARAFADAAARLLT